MKILVLTNRYPPYHIGGLPIQCQEVVEGLKKKGHEVKVLTSRYGIPKPTSSDNIHRTLIIDTGIKRNPILRLLEILHKEIFNRNEFIRLYKNFSPDIVYFWGISETSLSLIRVADNINAITSIEVGDFWLCLWNKDAWINLWYKKPLSYLGRWKTLLKKNRKLKNIHFNSYHTLKETCSVVPEIDNPSVIYCGIDIKSFDYKPKIESTHRLLYVGQIVQHKGVHTAIEALGKIHQQIPNCKATLTLAGDSNDTEYKNYLIKLTTDLKLTEQVKFLGNINRIDLPKIYKNNDILLFPSLWDEPFGLTMLEAMASGLPVIGTGAGGSGEVLKHENTGLTFKKEDSTGCANNILRLFNDLSLFEKIRVNARKNAEQNFTNEILVQKSEEALKNAIMHK